MVLLYVFGAVALINCVYYFVFSKFSLHRTPTKTHHGFPPLSLIVCAKNEAENLSKHIPFWLDQNYPDFELILINDASIDESLAVMQTFEKQDSRIQIVNVKNIEAFWGNKKYALTLGIKRAKNNHLIFTDADCFPASRDWLSIMVAEFSDEKRLILGYGAYLKQPGFLNKLIRFETLMTAVQYFSYAKMGTPYMGVGRNLGYTSTLFYENRGFMRHIKIASGDDDLFVNDAATSTNTAICCAPQAFTYSHPKRTWKKWILQKRRHYTTAKLYKPLHRFLLGMYFGFNLLFWILWAAILFTDYWIHGLGIGFFRILIQYIIIGKAARKLEESDLVFLIPFYEVFLVFTQMSIFIFGRNDKKRQWK